jgi:hypothetical protein
MTVVVAVVFVTVLAAAVVAGLWEFEQSELFPHMVPGFLLTSIHPCVHIYIYMHAYTSRLFS